MRAWTLLMACGIAVLASASGVVRNVAARQIQPWQGLVEISYELTEAPLGQLEQVVTVQDRQHGTNFVAKTFMQQPSFEQGVHRLIWNARADGCTFKSTNLVFQVEVNEVVPPLYCVIDLSAGSSATTYPVAYLTDVPEGGWMDEHKTTKLVLRRVEAGSFVMGSPSGEVGQTLAYETQHTVVLSQPFWIGIFEMTQKQYQLVKGSNPSANHVGDSLPVERVSYDTLRGSGQGAGWPTNTTVDASSFLVRLRERTGLAFDLPTEAQWEYACRAGTSTALNNGKNLVNTSSDEAMDEVGRYAANGDAGPRTAEVGSYLPNAWGIYDMHGNMLEWTLDWHTNSLGTVTAVDPVGPKTGSYRVLRGGYWNSGAKDCRSSSRGTKIASKTSSERYGFRLCCPIE